MRCSSNKSLFIAQWFSFEFDAYLVHLDFAVRSKSTSSPSYMAIEYVLLFNMESHPCYCTTNEWAINKKYWTKLHTFSHTIHYPRYSFSKYAALHTQAPDQCVKIYFPASLRYIGAVIMISCHAIRHRSNNNNRIIYLFYFVLLFFFL